jgi:site-specific DNA-methyltransferase (adenine-specific)
MLEEYTNKIIHGDCLDILSKIPDCSIDLVVTSPPYNLKNSTGNGMKDGRGGKWSNAALIRGYENYDDCMPNDEYAKWQHQVLLELLRVIKDDGAIFYNHKWRVQAGLIQDRSDIVYDVPLRQIIIWRRKGGINFNEGYFLPTYEVIYMIAKKDFKLAPHANRFGDVWDIAQEQRNDHPAPFPVELIDRIISSTNAQLILDPFMGSGTTAVVAAGLGRNFIGIEISEKYCEAANERLERNKLYPEVAKFHQQDLFSDIDRNPKKTNSYEYGTATLF